MSCRDNRILIVDQDSVARENTARLLNSLGYSDIIEAGDGSEAIARCERLKFDAILTEIDTRPVDGLGLMAALRRESEALSPALNASTPLLVLTNQTRPDVVQAAHRHGARAYLLKPVCAGRLDSALNRVRPNTPRQSAEAFPASDDMGCANLVAGVT